MGADQLADDGQPQAAAAGVAVAGLVEPGEPLEDPVAVARAGSPARRRRRPASRAPPSGVAAARLHRRRRVPDGVVDQVGQDPAQARRAATSRRHVGAPLVPTGTRAPSIASQATSAARARSRDRGADRGDGGGRPVQPGQHQQVSTRPAIRSHLGAQVRRHAGVPRRDARRPRAGSASRPAGCAARGRRRRRRSAAARARGGQPVEHRVERHRQRVDLVAGRGHRQAGRPGRRRRSAPRPSAAPRPGAAPPPITRQAISAEHGSSSG